MSGLKTLCKMQLKDRINLSFLKSVKETIFKIILSIIKFALITIVIYFGFYILSYLRLVSLLPGVHSWNPLTVWKSLTSVPELYCSRFLSEKSNRSMPGKWQN